MQHRPSLFLYSLVSGMLIPFAALSSTQLPVVTVIDTSEITDSDSPSEANATDVILSKNFSKTATSLADVLQTQSGSRITRIAGEGSFSQISLRGSSAQQVMIYLDGMPLNDANGGGVDLSSISLDAIAKIEIYRNRAPIQFGQQYQGGVINLITHRANLQHKTSVSVQAGNFGSKKISLSNQKNYASGSYLLQLSAKSSENNFLFLNNNRTPLNPYDDVYEERVNAQTEQQTGLLKVNYKLSSNQKLISQIYINHQRQHLPNTLNSTTNNAYLDNQQFTIKTAYQHTNINNSDLSIKTDLNIHIKNQHYLDNLSAIGLGKQDNEYKTQSYQLQQYMDYNVAYGNWGELSVKANTGVKLEKYKSILNLDNVFSSSAIQRQRTTYLAGVALPYFSNDESFTITPSIQWQGLEDKNTRTNSTDNNTHSSDISLQLGSIYQFFHYHKLMASTGSATRQPSFYEKYSDRGFMVGNPNLLPETTQLRDIGYEYERSFHKNRLKIKATYFKLHIYANTISNAILQSYDSRGIGRSENMDEVNIRGIEAKTGLTSDFGTQVNINSTFQATNMNSKQSAYNQREMPNNPTVIFNIKTKQKIKKLVIFHQFHFENGAYYDRSNLLPVAKQTLHDIGIGYEEKNGSVNFIAKNLQNINTEYFNGYPSPGRRFYLTLKTQF